MIDKQSRCDLLTSAAKDFCCFPWPSSHSIPSPFYTIYGVKFYEVWEGNRHEKRRKKVLIKFKCGFRRRREVRERWCWCYTSKVLALLYSQGIFFPRLWMVAFFPLKILMPLINIFVKYVLLFSINLAPLMISISHIYQQEIESLNSLKGCFLSLLHGHLLKNKTPKGGKSLRWDDVFHLMNLGYHHAQKLL